MRFPAVARLERAVASHSVGVSRRDVLGDELSESEESEGEDAREMAPAGVASESVAMMNRKSGWLIVQAKSWSKCEQVLQFGVGDWRLEIGVWLWWFEMQEENASGSRGVFLDNANPVASQPLAVTSRDFGRAQGTLPQVLTQVVGGSKFCHATSYGIFFLYLDAIRLF